MCHCGSTGVERTPTKSQHTELTLEKTIVSPLLPGFELATVRRSYQQAIPNEDITRPHPLFFGRAEQRRPRLFKVCAPKITFYGSREVRRREGDEGEWGARRWEVEETTYP